MKTKYLLGLAVLGLAAAGSVTPARAGLSFHISIGVPLPPPVIHLPAPCPPPAPVVCVPPPRVVCAPPPVVFYPPRPVCVPAPVFVPPGKSKRHYGHPVHGWSRYSHR